MSKSGYVYIMANKSLKKGLYKIGKTIKKPHQRAKELSSPTGVPTSYDVIWELFVVDCDKVEKIVHEKLREYRVNASREFFSINLLYAQNIIKKVAKEIQNQPKKGKQQLLFNDDKKKEVFIYEELTETEQEYLIKHNPYMDYHYEPKKWGIHEFQTFCAGFIDDVEQRKIRFFDLNETKQGLIFTDIITARNFCIDLSKNRRQYLKNAKYDFIFEYIKDKPEYDWYFLAIPVSSYIEFSRHRESLLNNLDKELLKEYNLDEKVEIYLSECNKKLD